MRRFLWVLRFFWVVSPQFKQAALVSLLMAAFGVWTIWVLPEDAGAPYVLILFCQIFSASSGFRTLSDLGRFDAALIRGATRLEVGSAHWVVSAAPGVVAWCVVSAVELWWLGPISAVGISLSSLGGLVVVSSVAWAVSLPTVRFFGGVLWVLLMGSVSSSGAGVRWLSRLFEDQSYPGLLVSLHNLARCLVVPFLYLVPSAESGAGTPFVIVGTGVLSVLAVGTGLFWIARRDFPGGS